MDANGTRFKLLLGRDDWAACTTDGEPLAVGWRRARPRAESTGWDDVRDELTLAQTVFRFPGAAAAPRLRQADRRAAAIDRYGNWYRIDDAGTAIVVTSSGTGATTRFWPPMEPSRPPGPTGAFGRLHDEPEACPLALRGLAVTADHHLVVGTLGPGGILVFDLVAGGPPWRATWPDAVGFAPLDLAARPTGGAYVLDAPARGPRRAWRLDRHFLVEPPADATGGTAGVAPLFAPLEGSGAPPAAAAFRQAAAVTADDAVTLDGEPVAIAVGADELVLVLDRRGGRRGSVVRAYDAALRERPGSPLSLDGLPRQLVAHAMAVVPAPDGADGEAVADLFLTDVTGDQAFRFPVGGAPDRLRVEPEYWPMRLYDGRAFAATPTGPAYLLGDRWVLLAHQPRPQYAERAEVVTGVFDSGLPGCVWHRLLFDGCLPPETSVAIWSAAADERADLDAPAWSREPVPYRRGNGSERPFAPLPPSDRHGTWELLFQGVTGRYLRLRLELRGNRRESPRIRSLRASYPRFSYLEHYLPGVYRESGTSTAFLDGFLANLEGTYTGIEDRIAAVERLFDPAAAPREALDWLAGWFGVVLDAGWDDHRRRLFLRHAVELFRYRGTVRGLRMAVGIARLACPDDRLFDEQAAPRRDEIRIAERFLATRGGGSGDPDGGGTSLPRDVGAGGAWTPGRGGAALHARWAEHVGRLVDAGRLEPTAAGESRFPVRVPAGLLGEAWQAFSAGVLGFVPSAADGDAERWRAFLVRRHGTPARLAAAYGLAGPAVPATIDEVPLPAVLPADGAALADWYAFESVVLAGVRAAHRFSVLLPVPPRRSRGIVPNRPADVRERVAEQERVARLVELEKPAHTTFDVVAYWLAFRVGRARLGSDTLLDLGSRSPDLAPAAIVGAMAVGAASLSSSMADVPARAPTFSGSLDPTTRRVARRTDG